MNNDQPEEREDELSMSEFFNDIIDLQFAAKKLKLKAKDINNEPIDETWSKN